MKKYALTSAVMFASMALVPFTASAATVYLQSSQTKVSVGDIIVVSAKIDSDSAIINSVDGEISLSSPVDGAAVQEFSLGGSSFGLWPRTPSLSADGRVISFVGGVPGGFNFQGATLFSIVLEAKKEGTITLSPRNLSAFLNDGKGTKAPVQLKSLSIQVGPHAASEPVRDDWKAIVSADTQAPEDFVVVLGQDSTLFDGKKFAFFSAVDNQSGVAYYEVSENDGPAVRSGSTYVLQQQDADPELRVTAYDKAGNKKVSGYPDASTGGTNWLFIIIVVIVIAAIWYIVRKMRAKKNSSPYQQ